MAYRKWQCQASKRTNRCVKEHGHTDMHVTHFGETWNHRLKRQPAMKISKSKVMEGR